MGEAYSIVRSSDPSSSAANYAAANYEGSICQRSDIGGVYVVHVGAWIGLRRLNDGDFGAANITTTGTVTGTKLIGTSEIQLISDDAFSPFWTPTALGFGVHSVSTANGDDVFIVGQNGGQSGNTNGGFAIIIGGGYAGTGFSGGVSLALNNSATPSEYGITVQRLANTARRFVGVACFDLGKVTTTQMPVNTGDGVVYWRTAVTDPTAPAVGGVIVYGSGGVLRIFPTSKVPVDLAPRGTISTGQGRPADERFFASQLQTSGNVVGNIATIDISAAAGFGDGIYTFEIVVHLNNVTDTTAAMCLCSGGWANRGGAVAGIIFPYLAGSNTVQGAGALGATVTASFTGTIVSIEATTGAGNIGKTIDWDAWIKVKRMALT